MYKKINILAFVNETNYFGSKILYICIYILNFISEKRSIIANV